MSRHFCPRPSQIARDRAEEKQSLKPEPEPPYRIIWWVSTHDWETTDKFFMSFKGTPDRDQVYGCLAKVFPGIRVFANWGWFMVELSQKYTWGEVKKVTALALKELVG